MCHILLSSSASQKGNIWTQILDSLQILCCHYRIPFLVVVDHGMLLSCLIIVPSSSSLYSVSSSSSESSGTPISFGFFVVLPYPPFLGYCCRLFYFGRAYAGLSDCLRLQVIVLQWHPGHHLSSGRWCHVDMFGMFDRF